MKKRILMLGAIGLTGLGFACGKPMIVKAEEVGEPEVSQVEDEFDFGAWFSNVFDAKTIITLLSDGVFIGAILKLVTSLVKEKKLTLEAKNEANKVIESLKKVLGDEVVCEISKKFDEITPKIAEMSEKTQAVLTDFAKVLALSQENTPESRVAVLEVLAKIGLVDNDLIEEAKENIAEEVKVEEQKVEEVKENLDKIIEDDKETGLR